MCHQNPCVKNPSGRSRHTGARIARHQKNRTNQLLRAASARLIRRFLQSGEDGAPIAVCSAPGYCWS